MSTYGKYIKKGEIIERLVVVGPMEESNAVMAEMHADGFRLTRTGPYTDREMHPDVDISRFMFIAESVLEGEG